MRHHHLLLSLAALALALLSACPADPCPNGVCPPCDGGAVNGCGGCAALTASPGDFCDADELSLWICDDVDTLTCKGGAVRGAFATRGAFQDRVEIQWQPPELTPVRTILQASGRPVALEDAGFAVDRLAPAGTYTGAPV